MESSPNTIPVLRTATPAEKLNNSCFCIWPRREALTGVGRAEMFSDVPSYVATADMEEMLATVTAVEAAARLRRYREKALGVADPVALADHGPAGAFMGYDFHLGPHGPRLIEVNTNAGGAALNAALLDVQRACCEEVDAQIARPGRPDFATRLVEMFASEWARQRSDRALETVAIVDDDPAGQFLYPEFELIAGMLEAAGIRAVIADAAELALEEGRLVAAGMAVDLVYNRLTDFMLAEPRHRALREAYEAGSAVVTPNPHVYALLADKRNLLTLSDERALTQLGLDARHVAALRTVPRTLAVTADSAEELWRTRRTWFFKPHSGHGSKAVYRGDKLTRGVWAGIAQGGYVAQEIVVPSERTVRVDGALEPRKMDVRLYTYDGRLLLAAARLYQGQATNFRTKGGGFSPVFVV